MDLLLHTEAGDRHQSACAMRRRIGDRGRGRDREVGTETTAKGIRDATAKQRAGLEAGVRASLELA